MARRVTTEIRFGRRLAHAVDRVEKETRGGTHRLWSVRHTLLAKVADAVAELVDELPRVGRITFRALTGDLVERLEVVVRFLAVLELFKVGLVDLDQAVTFGDIVIVWRGGDRDVGDRLAGVDAYDG